jgi:hypothetical protein
MLRTWQENLESLEAIRQDEDTCDLVLRMSALSRAGKLGPFLLELAHDDELDEMTKGTLTEIAQDRNFLHTVGEYFQCTEIFH